MVIFQLAGFYCRVLIVKPNMIMYGVLIGRDVDIDIQKNSTLGFQNLHHRSTRVQNGGIDILDPPGGLGKPGGVATGRWLFL